MLMSVSGMKSPSVIRHWGNLDNKNISKARLNQAWINEDEDGDINVLVCLPIDLPPSPWDNFMCCVSSLRPFAFAHPAVVIGVKNSELEPFPKAMPRVPPRNQTLNSKTKKSS